MQIRRTMLSQIRLMEDHSQAFKPLLPPPAPASMNVSMAPAQHHHYVHYDAPALPPLRMQPPPLYYVPRTLPPVQTAPTYLPAVSYHNQSPVSSVSSPSSESSHKCSLAFILSGPSPAPEAISRKRSRHETESSSDVDSVNSDAHDHAHTLKHKRRTSKSTAGAMGSKSKYCIVEGCTSRAKHARKCWKHGGSVKCKVADCINRAKSRGVCWSHGGGTTCSHADCGTIAVSHGFCWAHGGGKRCEVGGCSRPAYERTQNLCATHFKQQKAVRK